MADEINVTVTDNDNITLNVAGDTAVSVNVWNEGSQIKDTHVPEKFTGLSGANVELELGNIFRAGSCRVFLNGILQEKDVDYEENEARNKITMLIELETSDKIEVDYVID
jgi:hypothetical protein